MAEGRDGGVASVLIIARSCLRQLCTGLSEIWSELIDKPEKLFCKERGSRYRGREIIMQMYKAREGFRVIHILC